MTKEREKLLENAKLLPPTPGVYIMRNKAGAVIYVGKSKALQHRVSSYFASYSKHGVKTQHMVDAAYSFEVYHTKTELEALLLENQFIKQYMPKYNIKLKDSSGYPYIELTAGEYPAFSVVYDRKRKARDAKYFGPFSSAGAAHSILSAARKAFKLPSCKKVFPRDIGRGRPCLNYHIKQCAGFCVKDKVSHEEYLSLVEDASHFLKGDYAFLIKTLERKMEDFAENLEFERAAKIRDTISNVKKINDRQHIVASPDFNADVIGIFADELGSAVNIFFVRNGAVADRECLFFGSDELIDSESITSLLFRFYALRGCFPPKNILIGFDLTSDDKELISTKLSEDRTIVSRPRRGEKKRLLDLAEENAKELCIHKREAETKATAFLANLAGFLGLEVLPERIEGYDVSNHGDEHIVCGMAVWEKTRFVKNKYRSFTMRTLDFRDDYASMREAVSRRITHTVGEWEHPDLILLDGGVGHVRVIKELLDEKGINIPVFGMIKDEHHKTRTLTDGQNEISLLKRQDMFNFFYKFQEECHAAAFKQMDRKRRKSLISSSLTEIAGVGEKTAEKLLKHFSGLAAIKSASEDELTAVGGLSRQTAQNIVRHFAKNANPRQEENL